MIEQDIIQDEVKKFKDPVALMDAFFKKKKTVESKVEDDEQFFDLDEATVSKILCGKMFKVKTVDLKDAGHIDYKLVDTSCYTGKRLNIAKAYNMIAVGEIESYELSKELLDSLGVDKRRFLEMKSGKVPKYLEDIEASTKPILAEVNSTDKLLELAKLIVSGEVTDYDDSFLEEFCTDKRRFKEMLKGQFPKYIKKRLQL